MLAWFTTSLIDAMEQLAIAPEIGGALRAVARSIEAADRLQIIAHD